MKKKLYENAESEIIMLSEMDVIVTSGENPSDNPTCNPDCENVSECDDWG